MIWCDMIWCDMMWYVRTYNKLYHRLFVIVCCLIYIISFLHIVHKIEQVNWLTYLKTDVRTNWLLHLLTDERSDVRTNWLLHLLTDECSDVRTNWLMNVLIDVLSDHSDRLIYWITHLIEIIISVHSHLTFTDKE